MENLLADGWSQGQANNLILLVVAIVVALLVIRMIARAVIGVLFFRLRHIIIAFLLSIAGGVPLAGFGGMNSLAGAGGTIGSGLCSAAFSLAAMMTDSPIDPLRMTGQAINNQAVQLCGRY